MSEYRQPKVEVVVWFPDGTSTVMRGELIQMDIETPLEPAYTDRGGQVVYMQGPHDAKVEMRLTGWKKGRDRRPKQ